MSDINITIPDKDFQQLQEIDTSRNISMEDLMLDSTASFGKLCKS